MTTDEILARIHDIACALSGGPADCDVGMAAYRLGRLQATLVAAKRESSTLSDRLARMTAERDEYANVALAGLGGLISTPKKGYLKDGGPGQLRRDFETLRKEVEEIVYRDGDLQAERSNLRGALQRIADRSLLTEEGRELRRWAREALGWREPAEALEGEH